MIHDLCQRGTEIIHGMNAMKTDTLSHHKKSPYKFLLTAEKEKIRNYLEDFLQNRRHLSPCIISVDGLLGVEVEALLKCLANLLATKWNHTYSRTHVYVNGRVAVPMVRSTQRCIRCYQVPA